MTSRRATHAIVLCAGLLFGSLGGFGCGSSADDSKRSSGRENQGPLSLLTLMRPHLPSSPLKWRRLFSSEDPSAEFPKACDGLYSDDELQTFSVEIDPAMWRELEYEHAHAERLKDRDIEVEQYRPLLEFEHRGRTSPHAMIRLRGNSNSWKDQDKMQFQISFDEIDEDGRFRGQRKIVLDSASYNPSHLRDRLAASVFRDLGVPAPCVNHAKLFVNGRYYGLFANIEKVDREFLERNFADPTGNLWKQGDELKTNRGGDQDDGQLKRFWKQGATDLAEFEAMADVEGMARALAAEAFFPNEDGYWAGGLNFYLYEHPTEGFVYLPWDLDRGFESLSSTIDPLVWTKLDRPGKDPSKYHGHPHLELLKADPHWRGKFVDEIANVLARAPAATLQARIDRWAEQIEEAAAEDRYPPWNFEEHREAVEDLRRYVQLRSQRLASWVSCTRENGDQSAGCM